MARPGLDNILSHWNALHEGFRISSQEFYAAVEKALERRGVPLLSRKRVSWSEGGVFSTRRDYLRIERERLTFDICAAPFGTGFFFSWWLVERRPLRTLVAAPALLVVVYALHWPVRWVTLFALRVLYQVFHFGDMFWMYLFSPYVLLPLIILMSIFVSLWLARVLAFRRVLFLEDGALAIPGVNWAYGRFFRPITYFWIDSTTMFQTAVHKAVLEVIEEFATAQGVRSLTTEEAKPVFQKFVR